jgi:hypothetical protein
VKDWDDRGRYRLASIGEYDAYCNLHKVVAYFLMTMSSNLMVLMVLDSEGNEGKLCKM